MKTTRDKWTPEAVGIVSRKDGKYYPHVPVDTVKIHPPGVSAVGAIYTSLYAVELVTFHGSRWYCFPEARIDSFLRCRVSGFDSRFEEVSAWPDAQAE
jgi:hypothetical protein